MNRNVVRWIPAVVTPAIIAAAAFGVSTTANADVVLPDKTASQILQFINQNPNIAFSGEVTKIANLGLPNINLIPNISQAVVDQMSKNLPKGMSDLVPRATVQDGLTSILGFLSGTQNANIYVDGLKAERVQILDPMSERDFIHTGSDLWYYDAGKQTVTHHKLTAAELAPKGPSSTLDTTKLPFDINSPASVADYFINQASTSTTFTVGRAARVAGRDAYTLTLTPKSAGSLVESVTLSVDGTNGLPLGVTVKAVGQSSPAFEIAFTSINFATPDASIFAFTPPAGSRVTEVALPTDSKSKGSTEPAPTAADQAQLSKLQSEGWSAVVEVPAAQAAPVLAAIKGNVLYADLTKPVAGGRIFGTALLNILFTDDGRVFAGAVTTQTLLEAAAR